VRKTLYAITLALFLALIIQSVWGAQPQPVELLTAASE
jgi:hypothetical protein